MHVLVHACIPPPSLSDFRQVEARRRALGAWRGGEVEGVWHARQTVGNACGAVAIAHLVAYSELTMSVSLRTRISLLRSFVLPSPAQLIHLYLALLRLAL